MKSSIRHAGPSPASPRHRAGTRIVTVGMAAGAIALAALTSTGGNAGAAPSPVVLHYFQKQTVLTFYNASNRVIQGYPPVGGHVREDHVDYVGTHLHHAKRWTVSDHLYCTLVSSPATANCSTEFAVGGALIYTDNWTVNLAGDASTVPVSGGTGRFAGYEGTAKITPVNGTDNGNVVISLHKT